jgi:hypothetical protein
MFMQWLHQSTLAIDLGLLRGGDMFITLGILTMREFSKTQDEILVFYKKLSEEPIPTELDLNSEDEAAYMERDQRTCSLLEAIALYDLALSNISDKLFHGMGYLCIPRPNDTRITRCFKAVLEILRKHQCEKRNQEFYEKFDLHVNPKENGNFDPILKDDDSAFIESHRKALDKFLFGSKIMTKSKDASLWEEVDPSQGGSFEALKNRILNGDDLRPLTLEERKIA